MNDAPSPNTKAILLLTAPLIIGRGRERESSPKPLTPGEYNRLARRLVELRRQPADLLGGDAGAVIEECRLDEERRLDLDADRLARLLDRGFLLSQAMQHWGSLSIWVTSRADTHYPRRLKERLGKTAPAVLYGCGRRENLDSGGLAVVGSRNVDDALIDYTEGIGRLAAEARRTLISGGARGIDQAAMRGALEAGGTAAGVLADSLERAATRREHRDALMTDRLVLICPYDPAARFLAWRAMERNKLVYALADAALVVSAEFEKGGTWAGAKEQLRQHRFVSVYVRAPDETGKGLDALLDHGAKRWPNPDSGETLAALLDTPNEANPALGPALPPQSDETPSDDEPPEANPASGPAPLPRNVQSDETPSDDEPPQANPAPGPAPLPRNAQSDETPSGDVPPAPAATAQPVEEPGSGDGLTPAEVLFAKVGELLLPHLAEPRTKAQVAEVLAVNERQAHDWLKRLVDDGRVERLKRPVTYRIAERSLLPPPP